MTKWNRLPVMAIAVPLLCGAAEAAELRIGMASEASSLDPHYHNVAPNNTIRRHIFEALVDQDARQGLIPKLAESWNAINDTTWEFKLRRDVTFHDGTPFTAQDFIYTVCRIANVADSPSPFTIYTKGIEDIVAPDPHTLMIRAAGPYPLLPAELSSVGIMSAKAAGGEGVVFKKAGCESVAPWPPSQAFNDRSLTVGTGPFTPVESVKGERLVLVRNDAYWGPKPQWDRVVIRPITSDGPRVAAILAGEIDMIDEPPLQHLDRLKESPKVAVVQTLSNRVIYLAFDHVQEPTPTVKGTGGKNPFKDRRVREAFSKAIDRDAIVTRVLGGVAVPASQLITPKQVGHNPEIKANFDPAAAKRLLAEAGYPDGFQLTIGTPNDRYINDERIAQAVALMLTRVGIKTKVDATTANVFFARRNKQEFSVYLAGWGATTGEASSPLKSLVASPSPEKGAGLTNHGGYSNPQVDTLLLTALATADDTRRETVLAQAMKVAMDDFAIIPLHHEVTSWILRKGLTYDGRADQCTLAQEVRAVE